MFSLREFIKGGLLKAVGSMADYKVILNAAGWFEKGVLEEADLAEIQSVIDARSQAEEGSEAVGEDEEGIEIKSEA